MANPFDIPPSAVRADTNSILAPDDLVGLEMQERKRIKEQEAEDRQKLNEIRSLKNHPGWQQIKTDVLDKRIASYASGESLRALVANPKVTDEELGGFLRKSMDVADELQLIVNMIENAGSDE